MVSATVNGEEKEFRAEVVLMAAGRVGSTDRLDLQAAGVVTLESGFVQVDDRLTTSQPNISAVGDVKGTSGPIPSSLGFDAAVGSPMGPWSNGEPQDDL